MKIRHLIALALCSLFITGCGWHLRGSNESVANIQSLNLLSGQAYGEMERSLRKEMQRQKIKEGDASGLTLTIIDQELRQNLLAYNDNINAAMFEIELIVRFTVTNAQGETIIPPNSERVVRTYEPSNNRRLATDREASLIKKEAYEELAINILRRVNYLVGEKK
ncbi:MAG: LPS assembly lipoprotein LptE [Pseudomonadales bacterium]